MIELQINYDKAVMAYITAFEKKQDCKFNFWADKNNVADFNQKFLSITDIIFDIDNNCPNGQIFEWYDAELDAHYQNLSSINYRSWNMGARDELRYKTTL